MEACFDRSKLVKQIYPHWSQIYLIESIASFSLEELDSFKDPIALNFSSKGKYATIASSIVLTK